jgi:hypothetical protein
VLIRNIDVMGKNSGHKKGTKREKRQFLSTPLSFGVGLQALSPS